MKNNEKQILESVSAKETKPIDLIVYQDNSIVSQIILDKKAGTVGLITFDKDQGLSEHTAPFDAIIYILDGLAECARAKKLLINF